MNFITWLKKQDYDISKDIKIDKEFKGKTLESLIKRMIELKACDGAIYQAIDAYKVYVIEILK